MCPKSIEPYNNAIPGQFNVPQQKFILATQQNSNFGSAGLLGLAFASLAQSGGNPWWLNALSQFEQPEMSFYLAEYAPPFRNTTPLTCSSTIDGTAPQGKMLPRVVNLH